MLTAIGIVAGLVLLGVIAVYGRAFADFVAYLWMILTGRG